MPFDPLEFQQSHFFCAAPRILDFRHRFIFSHHALGEEVGHPARAKAANSDDMKLSDQAHRNAASTDERNSLRANSAI